MRKILVLWHILFLPVAAYLQNCGLEDTLWINPNTNHIFTIDVSGYFNDDLADPAQGVCGVEIEFAHTAVDYLELTLVSPGGDSVRLIGPNVGPGQGNPTFFAYWDITFLPCSRPVEPDSGFLMDWSNIQLADFVSGGRYSGSYYPNQGCFEFMDNGPVNGTWTILASNMPSGTFDQGAIVDFRILFCDIRGTECCFADAGEIINRPDVVACEGDTSLDFSFRPFYQGSPPDTTVYGYRYLIARENILLRYDSVADLTTAAPGHYQVCGLSYALAEQDSLPVPDGIWTLDSLKNNLNGPAPLLCADITPSCIEVGIYAPPDTVFLPAVICSGESFMADDSTYSATGTYTINLASFAGCDSVVVLDLVVAPVETTALIESICSGDSVLIGSSAYFSPGLYVDTLKSVFNCDSIVQLDLTVFPPDSTFLNATICSGQSYVVGDSTFTQSGNYEIPFLSSQGCDSIVLLNLFVLSVEVSIAVPDTLNCLNNSVILDGTGSSPSGAIGFEWRTLSGNILGTAPTLAVDIAREYVLTVFQQQGGTTCADSDTVSVSENLTLPQADAGTPAVLTCATTEVTLGGPATSMGPGISYRWQTDTGHFLSDTTITDPVVDAPGTYTLTVTDRSNSCTATASVAVSIDTIAPVADAGPAAALTCEVTSVVLDGSNSASGPDITYSWTSLNGIVPLFFDSTNPLVDTADTYRLVVANQRNGCSASDTTVVTIDSIAPQVVIAPPARLDCAIREVTLDAGSSTLGAGFELDWRVFSGGNILSGSDSAFPVVNASGGYELMIHDLRNGCRDSASVIVVDTSSVVLADPGTVDPLTCRADTVVLDASLSNGNNLAYFWSTSGGVLLSDPNQARITAGAIGVYELIVQDTITFCSDTAQAIVFTDTLPPLAEAGPAMELNCVRTEVALDGSASSSGASVGYQWSGPCLTGGSDTPGPVVNCQGWYYLQVTNTLNGCSATDSVLVTADSAIPVADAGPDRVLDCNNTTLVLDGSGSTAGDSIVYQWTGPRILSGDRTLNPVVGEAGIYTLLVLNRNNTCSATANVTVQLDTLPPVADAGPPALVNCSQPQVNLGGTGTTAGPGIQYRWSTTNGRIVGVDDQPVILVDSGGIYRLTVINTQNGCEAFSEVVVTADFDLPFSDAGADQLLTCSVKEVTLDGRNSESGSNIQYRWDGNCLVSSPDSAVVRVDCPGIYFLEVTNLNNGCSSTDSASVELDTTGPVAVAPDTAFLNCGTGRVTLDGTASSGGTAAWWLEGSRLVTGNLAPQVTQTGIYTLILTDAVLGCQDSTQVVVLADCVPQIQLAVPDTITCTKPVITLEVDAMPFGPSYTYRWTTSDPGCIVDGGDTPLPQIRCGGGYTVIVTNPVFGLSDTAQVTVVADTIRPLADAGPSDTLTCTQTSVTLDGRNSSSGPEIVYFWTDINGDTISRDPLLTVDLAGLYVLEVLNTANGCNEIDFAVVGENEVIPRIRFGNPIIPCLQDTFLLNAVVNPPNPGYVYQWQGPGIVAGSGSLNVLIDSTGTYILTVTNPATGCASMDSVIVTRQECIPCVEVALPDTLDCTVAVVTLSATFCNACTNCTIEWTTPDGVIDSGINSLSPQVSSAGTYILTVTDTLGFATVVQVDVLEDRTPPVSDAGSDGNLTCAVPQLTLGGALTSTGARFRHQWYSRQSGALVLETTPVLTVDQPDIYLLEVIDEKNGCLAVDSVAVGLDTLAPVAEAGPPRDLTCNEAVLTLDAGNSSLGNNIRYSWTASDNSCIVSGSRSVNPVVRCAGTYILTVRNIANECVSTDSTVVNLRNTLPPVPDITDQVLTCREDLIELQGTVPDPAGFTVRWCSLDANGNSLFCENQLVVEVAFPGNYRFEITDNATGCRNATTVRVTENKTPPAVEAGPTKTLRCDLPAVQLDGVGGPDPAQMSVQWSSPDGHPIQNDQTLNPLVSIPGTYYLTLIDNRTGCSARDSVVVQLDDNAPQLSAGPDTFLTCRNQEVRLAGRSLTPGRTLTYLWNTSDGRILSGATSSSPLINRVGTYVLTGTDTGNGCTASDTVVVSQNTQKPQVVLADSTVQFLTCLEDTLFLDASGSVSPNGAPLVFQWVRVAGGGLSGDLSSSRVQAAATGVYRLIVEDTGNGCRDSLRIQIQSDRESPNAVVAPPPTLTCERTVVDLDGRASSGTVPLLYFWNDAAGNPVAENVAGIQVTDGGSYELTVVNPRNGCRDSVVVRVPVDTLAPVIAIAPPDELDCTVKETTLNATGSSRGSQFRYEWTSASGGGFLTRQDSLIVVVDAPGEYMLTIWNNKNGCRSQEQVAVVQQIDEIEALFFSVTFTGCYATADGAVRIDSVRGGTEPYTFAWNNDVFVDRQVFSDVKPGSYTLKVQDARGCELEQDVVIQPPAPLVVDLGPDMIIELGDSLRIEALVNRDSVAFLQWLPESSFEDPSSAVQVIYPDKTGTFRVKVTDENGCTAEDVLIVTVSKNREVYVPTAFSPNGDGRNDVFLISAGDDVREVWSFLIFDRWGNLVYENGNFPPNDPTYGWDGTYKGKEMGPAVFVFFAEIEFTDGRVEIVKGDVVLVR